MSIATIHMPKAAPGAYGLKYVESTDNAIGNVQAMPVTAGFLRSFLIESQS